MITFDDLPLFRASDPVTSREGARDVKPRRGSQTMTLLATFAGYKINGLTDEEAGVASGLAELPRCCYWKRCSELRALGFIADMGTTRLSSAGSAMMVCNITPTGLEALK